MKTKKVTASNGQLVTLDNEDLNLVATGQYTEVEVADLLLANDDALAEEEAKADEDENRDIGFPE